jgi:alpha-D-ribose 1-methylphosphonate 5-triphosphate synthase subunit PhnG
VRGDQPFSPARLQAYGLTPIYDNAQRQLATAHTELDTMQRGNAMVARATPAELPVAGSMMAMDPQSEAVANALIGLRRLRGTGHCGGDDALAGSGLTL